MASPLVRLVALASLFASTAIAKNPPTQEHSWYKDFYPQPDEYCFNGCYADVDYITYNFTPPDPTLLNYYLNECSNDLKIKSMFYCAQAYCTREGSIKGRAKLNSECEENAGISLPTIDALLLSDADLANVTVLNYTAGLATAEAPVSDPAIPDSDWHALGQRTVKEFYLNWDLSFDFTFALIGFWAFVILVGAVHRVVQFMKKPYEGRQASWWLWIRKTLILPATFGQKQAEGVAYLYTIPPRLESIILGLYLIMNFVMCFPGYNLFVGNQYYTANKLQLARYIADRTGFLSIAQLPMVWVFAARNDPFMWLSGWSFATYNRFHRWIARISVLHAVVHSIAYTIFDFYSGGAANYYASWKEEYWYCGGIATVIMCFMLAASAYYFRERYYDLFLMIHIGMSLIFFVTLWYHVRIFGGEFNYYLYPCIAIWGLDRLLRVGRTVFVSIMPRLTKGVRATVTYHRTTDMVRMDLTDFFPDKKVVPGLYYYLYMPKGIRGYESHPFTLCSWHRIAGSLSRSRIEAEVAPDYRGSISVANGDASPTSSLAEKELKTDVRPASEDLSPAEVAHTFLVRPYKGMTGRLQTKLLAQAESVASTQETVFLEGPYGEKLDLSNYSDVLVVCGGSGITAAISHSSFLVNENSTTRVHIAWAVPQRHLPDDICANELASVIHTDRCNMEVYLTSAAEEEAQQDPTKLPPEPPYTIKYGRPDVQMVMREYRQKATKSLAIVTCGTPQFADDCRQAVVRVLDEEGVDVGYYNETMVW